MDTSHDKSVRSVEHSNSKGTAEHGLKSIKQAAMKRWPLNSMAIVHRVCALSVNDVNLTVAIGAGHQGDGLAACAFAVDEFKAKLPTIKNVTYPDGTVYRVRLISLNPGDIISSLNALPDFLR
jgi:molybdopterin synthase catalytic subunit